MQIFCLSVKKQTKRAKTGQIRKLIGISLLEIVKFLNILSELVKEKIKKKN